MCVIAIVEDKRPTEDAVSKMYNTNPAGGGIAWREKGLVFWKKGLTLDEMQDLCKKLPTPYVAHFRIPSCGGKLKALCHPFPVSKDVDLALEGSTKGYVMFHNGHWGPWKDNIVNAVIKGNKSLPLGKWSDSRAMAWMAGNFGLGMLEIIDEKTVAFGPGPGDKHIRVTGSGWALREGIWVSNTHWESRGTGRVHTRFDDEDAWNTGFDSIKGPKRWDARQCRWVPLEEFEAKQKEEKEKEPVVDNRLPTHYLGPRQLPPPTQKHCTCSTKKDDPTVLHSNICDLYDKTANGGAVAEDPFVVATRLFRAGQLSRKAWKRARKAYDKRMRKLFETQRKGAERQLTADLPLQ